MNKGSFSSIRSRFGKWLVIVPAGGFVFIVAFLVYFNLAFPEVRCDAVKHLESPDSAADCYACHLKATPKVAQDWYESKHGVMLVKCFVCHGQPDNKGAVPYALKPDVNQTCRKCHDPSVHKMEARFGLGLDCNQCHPFHQNSLHHEVYTKNISRQTIE